MFEVASDEKKRLWVAIVGGATTIDADLDGVIRMHQRVAALSSATGEPSIQIMVVLPGSVRPPPVWRQRFADAEKLSHGKRVAFTIVTDSAVLRGIRIAVNWLAPPPPGYETGAEATLDAAIAWAEKRRPGVSADLRALYRDVSGRARMLAKGVVGG